MDRNDGDVTVIWLCSFALLGVRPVIILLAYYYELLGTLNCMQ